MKLFVPLDDYPFDDPAAVRLPLVPFRLDFACQRDLDREGRPLRTNASRGDAVISDECPGDRPA